MTNADILSAIGSSQNSFARSIAQQIRDGRTLTPKQQAAIERFIAANKQTAPAVAFRFNNIHKAFAEAMRQGAKAPQMQVTGYKFRVGYETPSHDVIYVSREGIYVGKIQCGEWKPGRDASAKDAELIGEVDRNPVEALKRFGNETGRCSLCGRVLTDPESVRTGIGPICAEKWGVR
jgi:hypothetical protein